MAQIKPCWFVEARYVERAEEKRAPHRPAHLERIEKLIGEGVVVVGGALEDLSASVLILDVDSEEAARAIVETDAYYRNGVWSDYTIRRLNRVLPG